MHFSAKYKKQDIKKYCSEWLEKTKIDPCKFRIACDHHGGDIEEDTLSLA